MAERCRKFILLELAMLKRKKNLFRSKDGDGRWRSLETREKKWLCKAY
jgi:hypothetical protein